MGLIVGRFSLHPIRMEKCIQTDAGPPHTLFKEKDSVPQGLRESDRLAGPAVDNTDTSMDSSTFLKLSVPGNRFVPAPTTEPHELQLHSAPAVPSSSSPR